MIKEQILEILEKFIKGKEDIELEVMIPENENFGHFSTNIALKIGKAEAKDPVKVGEEIAEFLKKEASENFFEKVEVVSPGFINMRLSSQAIQKILPAILEKGKYWGRGKETKTVVIDYSHPNIAKPMSVSHLRSTVIGQALYNIFEFAGWKTIGDNHLGDWGKQFGILIAAYKKADLRGNELTIDDLMKLYVDYTDLISAYPQMEDVARKEVKKLQDGDEENLKIWKEFYDVSLKEFKKIYKILDVKFDYYLGESFYNPMLPGIIKEALDKYVAEISQGAVVIPINDTQPPFIIQKSDEAYLYSTTDIAAVKYRIEKFKANLILYVVDNGQSLHFEQLFKSIQKLGYVKDEKLVHVKFGLFLTDNLKKFSTRAGRHISLEGVINEAVNRARKVVDEKNPELSEAEKKKISEMVGIGALKYNDLSQNRLSSIAFNWNKMLNLEGNSAPYLQYTYARLQSILRKESAGKFDPSDLKEESELKIIILLAAFPDVIYEITKNYYPHYLADYLFELARKTNAFYQHHPVLKAETGIMKARLGLIKAVSETLKTGLNLLGISTPEKM